MSIPFLLCPCGLILTPYNFLFYFIYDCNQMQSEDEREMCARTVYCTNIDKKVLSSPCPG